MPATVHVMPRPEGRRPTPPARAWADVLDDRWTVARVRQALTAHINGVFVESAMLVDAMLGDDRIGADVRTRVLAVTGLPFRLEPSTLGDQRRAKAVAKEAERAWPRMAPIALQHDLARWGVLLGFATGNLLRLRLLELTSSQCLGLSPQFGRNALGLPALGLLALGLFLDRPPEGLRLALCFNSRLD